jgi:hypothetical protein
LKAEGVPEVEPEGVFWLGGFFFFWPVGGKTGGSAEAGTLAGAGEILEGGAVGEAGIPLAISTGLEGADGIEVETSAENAGGAKVVTGGGTAVDSDAPICSLPAPMLPTPVSSSRSGGELKSALSR